MLEMAVACSERNRCFQLLTELCFDEAGSPAVLLASHRLACVSFVDPGADQGDRVGWAAAVVVARERGRAWMLQHGIPDYERVLDASRMRFLAGLDGGRVPGRGDELGLVLEMIDPLYLQAAVEAARDPRVRCWEARVRALEEERPPSGPGLREWGSDWQVRHQQAREQRRHATELVCGRVRRRLVDLLLNQRLLAM
jgi:hypothetical protein